MMVSNAAVWKIEHRIRRSIRRIIGAAPAWRTKANYSTKDSAIAAFCVLTRKARYRDQFRLVGPDGNVLPTIRGTPDTQTED